MYFFSSFIYWWGPIPIPSGYAIMSFVTLGIVAKLIWKSTWTQKNIGINIVHVGALLLMFGGFLTAVWSTEGNMVIPEGKSIPDNSVVMGAPGKIVKETSDNWIMQIKFMADSYGHNAKRFKTGLSMDERVQNI